MTRRFLVLAVALVLGLASGGCSEGPLEPNDALRVTLLAGEELQLKNQTSRTIHYMVVERETLGLIYWSPGPRPDPGTRILAPHERLRIPYTRIPGYSPGAKQAVVHWWDLAEPDDIAAVHTVMVNL